LKNVGKLLIDIGSILDAKSDQQTEFIETSSRSQYQEFCSQNVMPLCAVVGFLSLAIVTVTTVFGVLHTYKVCIYL